MIVFFFFLLFFLCSVLICTHCPVRHAFTAHSDVIDVAGWVTLSLLGQPSMTPHDVVWVILSRSGQPSMAPFVAVWVILSLPGQPSMTPCLAVWVILSLLGQPSMTPVSCSCSCCCSSQFSVIRIASHINLLGSIPWSPAVTLLPHPKLRESKCCTFHLLAPRQSLDPSNP